MFIIKKLYYDLRKEMVIVEDGISCIKIGNRIEFTEHFWGESEVDLNDCQDLKKIFSKCVTVGRLVYTNGIIKKPLEDDWVHINFKLSDYKECDREGYVLFVKTDKEIETNGEFIFRKCSVGGIVKLKEKEHIEINGKRLEVINGNLMMYV